MTLFGRKSHTIKIGSRKCSNLLALFRQNYKSILKKIKSVCFRFLWFGTKEKDSIHLARWSMLSISKICGGLVFKNIFLIGHSLAVKVFEGVYLMKVYGGIS